MESSGYLPHCLSSSHCGSSPSCKGEDWNWHGCHHAQNCGSHSSFNTKSSLRRSKEKLCTAKHGNMYFPSAVWRGQLTQQKWDKLFTNESQKAGGSQEINSFSFFPRTDCLVYNGSIKPIWRHPTWPSTSCVSFWSFVQCGNIPPSLSASRSFPPHSCCPGIAFPSKTFSWTLCLGFCFLSHSYHKSLFFEGIKLLQSKNILSQIYLEII